MTQVEFEALIRALLSASVQDTERDKKLLEFLYAALPAVADDCGVGPGSAAHQVTKGLVAVPSSL